MLRNLKVAMSQQLPLSWGCRDAFCLRIYSLLQGSAEPGRERCPRDTGIHLAVTSLAQHMSLKILYARTPLHAGQEQDHPANAEDTTNVVDLCKDLFR